MIKQTGMYLLAVALFIVSVSHPVLADEVAATQTAETIVFSEVQTNGEGSGTTTQEFIELYNPTAEPVNMLGWSVIYINSSNNETVLYTFNEPYLFMPDTFLIGKNAATQNSYLPNIVADFTYTNGASGLAATAGAIAIKDNNSTLVDALHWTSAATYLNDNTVTGVVGGKSAQRKCGTDNKIVKTGSIVDDFAVGEPTPAAMICMPPSTELPPDEDNPTELPPDEEVDEPVLDTRVRLPLLLNELFVDPVSPLTDSNDEYVEIYNPNDTYIGLSGYRVIVGTTTKYTYTFPEGSGVERNGYVVVSSGGSPLSLSNSGSSAQLINDLGGIVDSVTYQKAIAGTAWARNSASEWAWTTSPTPSAHNVIIAPTTAVAKTTKKSTSITKKSKTSSKRKTNYTVALPIQLNEIYPDPKSPETDSNDEFVEVHNPHPYAINIADYKIVAGTTKRYTYTFPEATMIAPGGYVTVTSADTNVSLTNTNGQVVLINNFDKEIDSITYDSAKTGLSYARDEMGRWQWTSTITRNEKNVITAHADKASTTAVAGVVSGTDGTPLAPAPQPLPPWALAVLGVSAVCYAAYEYRFEVRNTIYKLRANRTAG